MKRWLSQKGQALVEMALILPLLLLLVFGIIEFGRVFHAYLVVTQVAREGARLAAVGGTDGEIIILVEDLAVGLDQDTLMINIDPEDELRVRGEQVKVEVGCEVELVAPVIAAIAPNPFPLSAEASMRVE